MFQNRIYRTETTVNQTGETRILKLASNVQLYGVCIDGNDHRRALLGGKTVNTRATVSVVSVTTDIHNVNLVIIRNICVAILKIIVLIF